MRWGGRGWVSLLDKNCFSFSPFSFPETITEDPAGLDANSDASSVCSERSYGSRNGGIPHYLRQTEDVAEVLNHCASSNWAERKEGLLGLQNLLKSQRTLR